LARDWSIRPARPDDAGTISAVLVRAGIDAWGGFVGAERIERANRGVRHDADLVAVDSEGVFAFVTWDEATGEVTRLYTDPRGQGRGAGSALLGLAAEALREAGCERAWLHTEERNDAVGFYLGRGWRMEGEPRVRDWHGVRLVEPRFVCDLDPPPAG
jgi:GNAT superfamily N-acetyltransferase